MIKFFSWTILLSTLVVILSAGFQFSVRAKSYNSVKTKVDSKSVSKARINKQDNKIKKSISSLILFEENKGQFARNVKFVARAADFNFYLGQTEAFFSVPNLKQPKNSPFTLNMRMLGANLNSEIEGLEEAVTKSGYYIGNDQNKWITDISNFQRVKFHQAYQGIDVIFHSSEQKFEYDFIVSPGSDPNSIKLEFNGVKNIRVDRSGNLVFKFKGIELRHQKPFAYQIINGQKQEISVNFVKTGRNIIGFRIGEYDKSKELVIDPTVYATYLGGTEGSGDVNDITVDKNGYIYTASDERIQTNPGDPYSTYSNMVVMKFNPTGNIPIYRNSYGGSADDAAYGIDVDSEGKAYLTGITYSTDFPLHYPQQSSHSINIIQQDYMAFVMRLYEDGRIHYSTYLGGGCTGTYTQNYGRNIVADADGNAYVTGYTCSANFPVRNAFQSSLQSTYNTFLTKYNSFGDLVYSTYFGGSGDSYGGDVVTDGRGNAYITGNSRSGLHTTVGAYKTSGLGFAAKFDTNRSGSQSLLYSTYIDTPGTGAVVDTSGSLWIITRDGFCGIGCSIPPKLFKLNSTGTGLSISPIPLGTYTDYIYDIAIDKNDNVFYVESESTGLKVVGLHSDGSLIEKSAIDTGTGRTRVWGVATGPEFGMVYIAGITYSTNFPTSPNAYQPYHNSPHTQYFGQGFFAKFQLNVPEVRNPVIFIPGIMGSHIRGDWNGRDIPFWININPVSTTDLPSVYNLTLDVNSPYYTEGLYASDVIRKALYAAPIYQNLLDSLEAKGYKPYDISSHVYPNQGCDLSQKRDNPAENPSLFVFPYDWRRDNNQTADKLREYVQCVQQFYPSSTKINVVAHSMGGLVVRRYILKAQMRNEPHGLGKVVTLASPFLGAPEAIYKLYTGGKREDLVSLFVIRPSIIKFLAPHMPSMHQLFPSRAFHQLNGGIIKESGDVNGNGIPDENYDFPQIVSKLNSDFPDTTPGTVGAGFHDFAGQDDWRNDQSGIEYFHIAAEQNQFNTTVGFSIKNSILCRIAGNTTLTECHNGIRYAPRKGLGDKTVPIISATRSTGSTYLGVQNSKCYVYRSPSSNKADEEKTEHTGMTQQTIIQDFVGYFLGNIKQQPNSPFMYPCSSQNTASARSFDAENNSIKGERESALFSNTQHSSAPDSSDYSPAQYLMITGTTEVTVRDEAGNTTSIEEGLLNNQVDGLINYEIIGEDSVMLTFSVGHAYTVEFSTGAAPMSFDLVEGIGNEQPTAAVRYNDVNIPVNSNVKFSFSQSNQSELKFDADKDGEFEATVAPTVNLSGAAANDTSPPIINIEVVQQGNSATTTITAQDTQSGVSRIWYSLDGQNFQLYNSPITLQYASNPIRIEAFSDDAAANRSGLYSRTYIFPPIINPTVAITAPESGSVYPVGTTVNFAGDFSDDQCSTHNAIWKFDNISQAGTVDESNRTISSNHTFTSAGVYLVTLTVNNNCGGTGTAYTVDGLTAMVVIYDSDGGFVTGGGWFYSPLGAYTSNPNLTGRASFGFNSKYQHGANVPTGNTEFQFRVADFNFKSTSYDWLVVAGAKAQFKGTGTINGNGNYGFMLTAIDGQINGGGGQDKFRIKIWNKSTNAVIYDNQLGSDDRENPTTVIGGGSIIIHKQ